MYMLCALSTLTCQSLLPPIFMPENLKKKKNVVNTLGQLNISLLNIASTNNVCSLAPLKL